MSSDETTEQVPRVTGSVKRDWIIRLDGSVYADPPVTDAERETDDGRWIAEARDRGGDWECVGVRRNQFLAMELIGDLDRYDRRIRRDNEDKGHP